MPNLALMDQLIPLLEGAKGTSLEQWQKMITSGLWPIFIESDFDRVDRSEFKKICKSRVVPDNLEVFELEVVGAIRRHTLISVDPQPDLNGVLSIIDEDSRFRKPFRSSLLVFGKRFPKSDGNGAICLPIGTVEGYFESIDADKRECWRFYTNNSSHEEITRDKRWLVEVVDEKFEKRTLSGELMWYVKNQDGTEFTWNGKSIKNHSEVEIGSIEYDGDGSSFVPFVCGKDRGYFRQMDVLRLTK